MPATAALCRVASCTAQVLLITDPIWTPAPPPAGNIFPNFVTLGRGSPRCNPDYGYGGYGYGYYGH